MISIPKYKVAIQPIPDPDMTSGGLFIPDIAKDRTVKGIVKYIGRHVTKDIQVGDFVMFSAYSGTTVQLGQDADGVLIIMRQEYIVAKFGPIDTEVPGLYFRSKSEGLQLYQELKNTLREFGCGEDVIIQKIVNIVAKYNPYFPATYEMMMNIAADSLRDHPIFSNMKLLEPSDKNKVNRHNARPDYSLDEVPEFEEESNE